MVDSWKFNFYGEDGVESRNGFVMMFSSKDATSKICLENFCF